MPEVAEQKSGELFDYLSVLLDDEDQKVSKVASQTLEIMTPVFPSAWKILSLMNCLAMFSTGPKRLGVVWKHCVMYGQKLFVTTLIGYCRRMTRTCVGRLQNF